MCHSLPIGGFKWMTDFDNWQDIPHILHDLHIDYPLAVERLMINKVEKTCSKSE